MLKTVCFGSATIVPSPEWVRSGFTFHTPENLHAFGLKASKGATKAFKLFIQSLPLFSLNFPKENMCCCFSSDFDQCCGSIEGSPHDTDNFNIIACETDEISLHIMESICIFTTKSVLFDLSSAYTLKVYPT